VADDAEMVALLREIRDLQKAHFERYLAFTAAALQRQEEAAEMQRRLAAASAHDREASHQYRMVTQRMLADAHSGAARMRVIMLIAVILQGFLLFALICIVFTLLRH